MGEADRQRVLAKVCIVMYSTVCYKLSVLGASTQEAGMDKVADSIRSFAAKEYIQPARKRGSDTVQIRVGDVHKALKLSNRVPNVSSALRSRIFLEQNGVRIDEESGPPSGMGTRTTFTYRLLDKDKSHGGAAETVDFEKIRG